MADQCQAFQLGSVSARGAAAMAISRYSGSPVLSELALEWEGSPPEEVYPSPLPDLHRGEPLIVSARFPGDATAARVSLHGRLPSGPVRTSWLALGSAPEGSGVGIRWARAKRRRA